MFPTTSDGETERHPFCFHFFFFFVNPGKFYKEVIDKCQSFNQLVYHQHEIVQSLKTHLQIRNSFAYQPLLE